MAILKIVDRNYSTNNINFADSMDDVIISYILSPQKAIDGFIFGFNVLMLRPADIAEQFKAVRGIFHKESGRLLRHFIISFAKSERIGAEEAFYFGIQAARYYATEHQIVFAVHQDSSAVHIHFVMNTISFIDGHKFSEGFQGLNNLLNYLNNISPNVLVGKNPNKKSLEV